MSRDMQKHLFDLCMSQIVTILASEIQRSSFQLQSFLLFKVAPLMGWGDFEQLWWSLFDRNACAMNWLFLYLAKRDCSGLSL